MAAPLSRRAALGLLAAPALVGCGRAGGEEVILTDGGSFWGRAQRRAFYDPFERATGIRVRTVPFAMPGKLRTSIEQGRPIVELF